MDKDDRALHASEVSAPRGGLPRPALVSSLPDGHPLGVTMRPASELFPTDNPNAAASLLRLQVPFFQWHGRHPKVPDKNPAYSFPSRQLVWTLVTLLRGNIPWLYGMPGTGKTTMPEQIAAALNWPMERINCDRYMRRAEIVGSVRPYETDRGGIGAKFLEGALPGAIAGGWLTVLDEISQGATEFMSVLTRVMEGKGFVLLEDGARFVRPDSWFRLVATDNTIGRGAGDSLFNNTNELSQATRDRIATWIEFGYMPEAMEAETVRKTVALNLPAGCAVDDVFVLKCVKLANEMRALFKARQIDEVISLRTLFTMADHHAVLAPLYPDAQELERDTLTNHVLNRCTDDAKEAVKRKANALFGNILH